LIIARLLGFEKSEPLVTTQSAVPSKNCGATEAAPFDAA
jgi:hypothetical protein